MSTYFIKCDVCNKDIITQHHNTKYCPDCKKNMRKKQRIAAEAKEMGLTYGKYMRLKGANNEIN